MHFNAILPQDLRTTASPAFVDITATGDITCDELTLTAPTTSDYKFTITGSGQLKLMTIDSGIPANFHMGTADMDGTDNVYWNMWGVGDQGIANYERIQMGWVAGSSTYRLLVSAGGSGTVRPLTMYTGTNTDQLLLNTDGTVTFSAGNVTIPSNSLIVGGTSMYGSTSLVVSSATYAFSTTGGGYIFASGTADQDVTMSFFATSNNGIFMWMEDEDYFAFSDDILMNTTERVYFRDTAIGLYSANDGYLDLFADTGIRTNAFIRHTSANYRRYYHLLISAIDPGASGATWTDPDANTTGGWQLDAAGETLDFDADIHADWDGASDMTVEVRFAVNIDNSLGNAADTVDLRLQCFYNGVGDTATKTQVLEVATTVGACAQYTVFEVTFTLNWDETDNVIEIGDEIGFILNLETDTSEVTNIILTHATFHYNTTHIGIESGDA